MNCGKKKKLGKGSPQVFIQTVWCLLTQYFGLRQEHHGITVEDWMKTTRSTRNSSRTRPKHASPDYPQSPETSFPKCLLLEVIDVPLQSSKSFSPVILPKYAQPVHFVCLVCQSILASLVQSTANGSEAQ